MYGERPVPVGTLTCASDRNQYLETGELNHHLGQNDGHVIGPPPPPAHRDRDTRHSNSSTTPAFSIGDPYLGLDTGGIQEDRELRHEVEVDGAGPGGPRLPPPPSKVPERKPSVSASTTDGEAESRDGDGELNDEESEKELEDDGEEDVRPRASGSGHPASSHTARGRNASLRDSFMRESKGGEPRRDRDRDWDRDHGAYGGGEQARKPKGGPRPPQHQQSSSAFRPKPRAVDSYAHNSDEYMSEKERYPREGRGPPPQPPRRARARDPAEYWDRDPRDEWDRSARYYDDRGDDSRPWSRNGYYEAPDPPHYSHHHPYPYGAEYPPPRRPADYEYRGYPPYRAPAPPPDFSGYGGMMFNTSGSGQLNKGYNTLPSTSSSTSKQQFKAYLEEFRVRDPPMYRDWYLKYKEHLANPTQVPMPLVPGYPPAPMPFMPNTSSQQALGRRTPMQQSRQRYESERERPIIHSGRSSVNENSIFNDRSEMDSSLPYVSGFAPIDHVTETTSPGRMTPQKFVTGHCIGLVTPLGQLIKVNANTSTVEITSVRVLMKHLPEFQELERFPGPLLKGKTYKNDVIKFCEKKIKQVGRNEHIIDRENLILLWELLILLIRQNGAVVGSDIAELLLKKKIDATSETDVSLTEPEEPEEPEDDVGAFPLPRADAKVTQRFCDLLLFGHKNGALEYAMNNGLWGHALFLASKMGERDYGQVMARFANGLAFNHPLQTLYQIMSGRQPSSVTSCGDDTFGDWKPHLAMIISNSEIRPDVACKAFVALGDTLRTKNHIYGGQFCYLMSQALFSDDSKLGPLLGLLPDGSNVHEATQMTEIYEYATSLSETNFNAGLAFLGRKFNYAKSLVDFGFTFEAYSYCEVLAKQLDHVDRKAESYDFLRWSLLQISERLQYCEEAVSRGGQEWIGELRRSLQEGLPSEETSRRDSLTSSNVDTTSEQPAEHSGEIQSQPAYSYAPDPTNGYPAPGYGNDLQVQGSNTGTNSYYNPTGSSYADPNPQQKWETQAQQVQNGTGNGIGYDPNGLPATSLSNQPDYTSNQNQNQFYNPVPQKPYDSQTVPQSLNNNYYPSQPQPDLYSTYGQQPPPLTNGPSSLGLPSPSSSHDSVNYQPNKKKTVRFEDEEELEASKRSLSTAGEPEFEGQGQVKSSLRMMSGGISSSGWVSSSSSSSSRVPIVSRGLLKPSSLPKPDSFDLDEPIVDPSPPDTTSEDEDGHGQLVPLNPVQFKSTYPIDAPFGARPMSLRTSKVSTVLGRTFPVDRHCCEVSRPCDEHYELTPTSSSSFPLRLPPGASSSAGPNFQGHGKIENYDPNRQPGQVAQSSGDGPKPDPAQPAKSSPKKEKASKNPNSGSSGWFGSGLFSKLPSFKGKNQMILPDDKEPTIVWDAKKGQWVNTKGEEEEDGVPKGPPPKDSDLMKKMGGPPPVNNNSMPPYGQGPPDMSKLNSTGPPSWAQPPAFNAQGQPSWNPPSGQGQPQPQMGGPGLPTGPPAFSNNIYKRAKGGSLRANYVDILNPGGGGGAPAMGPPSFGNDAPAMPPMFIPAPAPIDPSAEVNFLTQAPQFQFQGQEQQKQEGGFDGIR